MVEDGAVMLPPQEMPGTKSTTRNGGNEPQLEKKLVQNYGGPTVSISLAEDFVRPPVTDSTTTATTSRSIFTATEDPDRGLVAPPPTLFSLFHEQHLVDHDHVDSLQDRNNHRKPAEAVLEGDNTSPSRRGGSQLLVHDLQEDLCSKSADGSLPGVVVGKDEDTPQKTETENKEILQENKLKHKSTSPVRAGINLNQRDGNIAGLDATARPIAGPAIVLSVNDRNYQIGEVLGHGASAIVYRAVCRASGEDCALKIVRCKSARHLAQFQQEIDLLARLRGVEQVVQLIDYHVDEKTGIIGIVLEKAHCNLAAWWNERAINEEEGGDVGGSGSNSTRSSCLPPELIPFVWHQIVQAIRVLHEYNVIHCDIKPENFLVFQKKDRWSSYAPGDRDILIKIADLGIASRMDEDAGETHVSKLGHVGTLPYMAPEMMYQAGEQDTSRMLKLRKSADIWSLGCMLHRMIFGTTPFQTILQSRGQIWFMLHLANATTHVCLPSDAPLSWNKTQQLSFEDLAARPGSAQDTASTGDESVDPAVTSKGIFFLWLREMTSACLERDPASRPTIDVLLHFAEQTMVAIKVDMIPHPLPLRESADQSRGMMNCKREMEHLHVNTHAIEDLAAAFRRSCSCATTLGSTGDVVVVASPSEQDHIQTSLAPLPDVSVSMSTTPAVEDVEVDDTANSKLVSSATYSSKAMLMCNEASELSERETRHLQQVITAEPEERKNNDEKMNVEDINYFKAGSGFEQNICANEIIINHHKQDDHNYCLPCCKRVITSSSSTSACAAVTMVSLGFGIVLLAGCVAAIVNCSSSCQEVVQHDEMDSAASILLEPTTRPAFFRGLTEEEIRERDDIIIPGIVQSEDVKQLHSALASGSRFADWSPTKEGLLRLENGSEIPIFSAKENFPFLDEPNKQRRQQAKTLVHYNLMQHVMQQIADQYGVQKKADWKCQAFSTEQPQVEFLLHGEVVNVDGKHTKSLRVAQSVPQRPGFGIEHHAGLTSMILDYTDRISSFVSRDVPDPVKGGSDPYRAVIKSFYGDFGGYVNFDKRLFENREERCSFLCTYSDVHEQDDDVAVKEPQQTSFLSSFPLFKKMRTLTRSTKRRAETAIKTEETEDGETQLTPSSIEKLEALYDRISERCRDSYIQVERVKNPEEVFSNGVMKVQNLRTGKKVDSNQAHGEQGDVDGIRDQRVRPSDLPEKKQDAQVLWSVADDSYSFPREALEIVWAYRMPWNPLGVMRTQLKDANDPFVKSMVTLVRNTCENSCN